jgi:hypothetical protein
MSTTDSPFGDYTADVPSAATATTTYDERSVEPLPMMLYEEFLPEDWNDVWEEWQPDGDFTNAMIKPEVLNAILALYSNSMGSQIAALFFQGDTTLLADDPLNKFNGIVTRAIADVNVPKVTPAGVIIAGNVVAVIKAFWAAIPDKYFNNPDYLIMMNMTDYRLLQTANIALKEAFDGVLNQAELNVYISTKIIGLVSMPKDYVLGGVATSDRASTQFFMAMDQDENSEKPRIERKANGSKYFFIRIDVKADANYREATEVLLYEPA